MMKKISWAVFALLLLFSPPALAASPVGVIIDGEAVVFDDSYGHPFLDQAGRTQVPFRKTLETFGCAVSWDDDTRTAIAQKDGTTVRVPVGQPYIQANGAQIPTDTTAVILEGRTYLPIRAVLEAFGAQVTWDAPARQVVVTTGRQLLRVHFIDVGQGDAALIDLGQTEILIDGGPNQAGPDLVTYLTPWVDGPLEYLIATHPDADHIGGLDHVLAAFQVNEIIDSGFSKTTKTYQDYWAAVTAEPGCVLSYDENRVISLGPEAVLSLIETGDHWKDANEASVIAQLIYRDISILFTGDMTETVEAACLEFFGPADVLKVGHHGSATSTSPSFLAAVEPQYAVISYKTGNSYGHPTFQTLQRLLDQGVTVYGTGQSGTILLTSDGYNCTFSTSLTLSLEHAGNQ